jgi:PAS domain S-box-containing protein
LTDSAARIYVARVEPGGKRARTVSTERDAEVDALRAEIAFLRQVIDINPNLIFVKDRRGVFTFVNRTVAEVYGTTVDHLIGKTDADFNPHPEEVEWFLRHDREVMDEQKELVIPEELVTDAQGKGRWFQTIKRPLVDADGHSRHVLGVGIDITRLKQAEVERLKLEAQVRHAQKLESLGVLAGGIAHDFNNLLVGVLGNADVVQMLLPEDAPARGLVGQIQIAAQRAADLCRQLLAYSGRGRFVSRPLDLTQVVREMASLLEVSIRKTANLRLALAPDLPAVDVDPTQLRQVIMNLITNAADALGEREGVIEVRTGSRSYGREELAAGVIHDELPAGTYAFVEVKDDGAGMDAATVERIFDPFFTTKFQGRGLGLAAVLGIVRGHGGTIVVTSAPGAGTTFQVLLPVTDRPAVSDGDELPGELSELPRGEGTVLVIDDEETVREVARSVLELQGYTVLVARDGREGVDVFREHQGDVSAVLVDMTMPHGSGEHAVNELRRVRPDVPLVLMSGYDESEATARFARKGLAGFVQKPFRAEALLRAVHAAQK